MTIMEVAMIKVKITVVVMVMIVLMLYTFLSPFSTPPPSPPHPFLLFWAIIKHFKWLDWLPSTYHFL